MTEESRQLSNDSLFSLYDSNLYGNVFYPPSSTSYGSYSGYFDNFLGSYSNSSYSNDASNYQLIKEDFDDLPISVQRVWQHLKLDEDQVEGSDYYLLLIRAAILTAETITRMDIIKRTYRSYMTGFSYGPMKLYKTPVTSISSFQYYAQDGTLTSIDASKYYMTFGSAYPSVLFTNDYSFPYLQSRAQNVFMEFETGGVLRPDLEMAILQHIAVLHEQRGDWGSADLYNGQLIGALPAATQTIYNNYRFKLLNQ